MMADSASTPAKSTTMATSSASHYTPSRNASRRTSRHDTPLSSSPLAGSVNGGETGIDVEETRLSALDPRRFTPTLHANLVAEILNLRREVDNKNSLILGLEEQLEAAEDENKELGQTVAGNAQESRSLRRKLDALESGTIGALEKLSFEKKAATESLNELKRRHEAVQKKLKTREDEVDRMNALWDSDRQHWEENKRGLDRKAHVAESRIKMLLQELEVAYAQMPERRNSFQADRPSSRSSAARPFSRASGARSALGHRRGGSIDSFDGPRFSLDDGLSRPTLGNSLADELNMGSEDENDMDGYTSGGALPEERAARIVRPYSSQSNHASESAKARKVLGLTTPDIDDPAVTESRVEEPKWRSDSRTGMSLPALQNIYQDAATQWSPPTSPILHPRSLDTIAEAESLLERDSVYSSKRASMAGSIATLTDRAGSPTLGDPAHPYKRISMVSQACQTVEQPPSPPATPQSPNQGSWTIPRAEMISIATQTEADNPQKPSHLEPSPSSQVPFISVRRPSTSHSRNSSHEGPVLPPQTRSASSQTEAPTYSSASAQTESILIDLPDSPERSSKRFSTNTMSTRASLVIPARKAGERVSSLVKSFEFDTATRQLREIELSRRRRSARLSRYEDVFADFDGEHGNIIVSDMLEGLDLAELTDDSAASKEPTRRTLTRTQDGWKSIQKPESLDTALIEQNEKSLPPNVPLGSPKLVLEDETGKTTQLNTTIGRLRSPPPTRPPPPIPTEPAARPVHPEPHIEKSHHKPAASEEVTGVPDHEANSAKAPKVVKKAKEPDIRKMALISSGTTAHMQRPRSPSAPTQPTNSGNELGLDPPFPVPNRSSSKKLSWIDEPPSPGPGTVTFYGGGIYGRKTIKRSVRKARSGSSTRSPQRQGRASPSLDEEPPLSPSTFGLSSVTSEAPTSKRSESRKDMDESVYGVAEPPSIPGHKSSRSHGSALDGSVQESTTSDTSVVDSIAQTMVGEWMWKYVRRRKSFGLPESAAAEFELGKNSDGNAQRHQRWVWLAPYERAVMWSSKQPTSGPALMGKSGRKLVIQSVLDVRDDTPMPKGANQESSFGRSILILTAQRALKFTATSRERHNIWITALSFLSHSSVLPQTLNAAAPPLPSAENDPLPPPIAGGPLGQRISQPSLQRSRVHDSVRIAKDKKRPSLNPLSTSKRSFTTGSVTPPSNPSVSAPAEHVLEAVASDDDAAEPPLVPRFAKHTRKRSNTGLGVPPTRSFRSFASATTHANASKPSVYSYGTRSDTGSHAGGWATDSGTIRGSILSGMKHNSSHQQNRQSRALGVGTGTVSEVASPLAEPGEGPDGGNFNSNFFEAIGTVGMEAFVDGIDKMATDLHGPSHGRRNRKRDSLAALRERSRSIDRKRAHRISKDMQRRSRGKKDSMIGLKSLDDHAEPVPTPRTTKHRDSRREPEPGHGREREPGQDKDQETRHGDHPNMEKAQHSQSATAKELDFLSFSDLGLNLGLSKPDGDPFTGF